jgi:predicted Fe-Mo cluster-binding NifX family protein
MRKPACAGEKPVGERHLKAKKDMKVAITSTGQSLDSTLDQRFGRCAYFVIYDTGTGGMEIIPNPNREAEEGAGPASVQLVASRNVEKIISGEFGVKIKSLLDSLKIQMVVYKEPEKSIQSIIEMLSK